MSKTRSTKDQSGGNSPALVIVESPAKAKTINRYLGSAFIVEASMGHVRDLPKRTLGVDIEKSFHPTYRVLPSRTKVVNTLKKKIKDKHIGDVYLATDLDREGEAIAWHLVSALKLAPSRVKRVIFNEITKRAIQTAFEHPHQIDMDKVNAQQARRILDRIVGYQLSPLLWKKIARNLSAGRVQSVAVRLIVERERQIEQFIPEEHWRVLATLHGGEGLESARAAYAAYEAHCRALAEVKAVKGAAERAAPDIPIMGIREKGSAAIRAGDVLKHPKTGEELEVIDTADPSLLKVRTSPGGECVIGKKVVVKVDVARRGGSGASDRPALQIKDDTKRLNGAFREHRLFRSELIRFDDAPFEATTGDEAHRATSALEGATYTITSLETKNKSERPGPPFTTAMLQRQAATRLNFVTRRTMQVAQQLYEGVELGSEGSVALITYMRTDSVHLAADAVSAARAYIGDHFGAEYTPDKPNVYSSRASAQAAHEAIRPTDVTRHPDEVKSFLTADQFRLYDLIWRRFVACQMKPAVWSITEAMITAGTADHTGVFRANGRRLAFPGFLAVLPNRLDGADAELPALAEQQSLNLIRLNATQHFTQPPARFNEASLVRALESEGIGRPSTYASIISTIQDRGYVVKRGTPFHPTALGKVVTDQLVRHFPRVMDVKFTSHMEQQLDKIEEAHLDWTAVLNEFYQPFSEALAQASEHMEKQAEESDYTCETCGKVMVYRWTKTGRFLSCSGYPDCKTTCSVDDEGKAVKNHAVLTDHTCPECGKSMVLRESRYGPFLGCSGYPDCKTTIACDKEGQPLRKVKPEEIDKPCPECGQPLRARRGRGRKGGFLACTGYPKCKHTEPIPDDIAIEWPAPKESDVKCPNCGRPMLIRRSRRGPFLGCKGFPKCKTTLPMPKDMGTKDDAGKPRRQPPKSTG